MYLYAPYIIIQLYLQCILFSWLSILSHKNIPIATYVHKDITLLDSSWPKCRMSTVNLKARYTTKLMLYGRTRLNLFEDVCLCSCWLWCVVLYVVCAANEWHVSLLPPASLMLHHSSCWLTRHEMMSPARVCSIVTVHTTSEQCMVLYYYVRKYIFTNLQQWLALSWPPSRRPCPPLGQRTERLPTLLLPHLPLHSGSSTRSWIILTSLGIAHYFSSTSLSSQEVFKPLWRSNSSGREATNDSTSR